MCNSKTSISCWYWKNISICVFDKQASNNTNCNMHIIYNYSLFLNVTQTISLVETFVHKLIESGQLCVGYSQTLTRRGHGFTKCMTPSKFVEAWTMMSMISTIQLPVRAKGNACVASRSASLKAAAWWGLQASSGFLYLQRDSSARGVWSLCAKGAILRSSRFHASHQLGFANLSRWFHFPWTITSWLSSGSQLPSMSGA